MVNVAGQCNKNNEFNLSMNYFVINCPRIGTSSHIKQHSCPNSGTVLLQNIHAENKFIIFLVHCPAT